MGEIYGLAPSFDSSSAQAFIADIRWSFLSSFGKNRMDAPNRTSRRRFPSNDVKGGPPSTSLTSRPGVGRPTA